MASANIIIPDRIYKNGNCAIILQIIHERKKYRQTIYSVPADCVDRKRLEVRSKYPDAAKLNKRITKKLPDAKAYLFDCEDREIPIDPEQYFRRGYAGDDILSHLAAKISDLNAEERFRTAQKYKTIVTRITDSGMNRGLVMVNSTWIKEFNTYLTKHGNSPNTRGKLIGSLGSVFRQAKRDGVITVNPFEDYIKPATDGVKHKLSLDEFKALQAFPLTGVHHAVRNMFAFATMARGMRAHDLLTLRWRDIKDDRLVYTSQKNSKTFDIQLTPALLECLTGQDRSTEYVWPLVTLPFKKSKTDEMRFLQHVNSKNTLMNKYLAAIMKKSGIQKHVTLHVARHTFAFISDQSNLPLGTIQQLLGHSKMTTTEKYTKSLRRSEELDKSVEKLFNSK